MPNELLLILSLILIYACVVLFYRFLGKSGLYCWTVLATIAANIEVLIVVNAFGMGADTWQHFICLYLPRDGYSE